MELVFNSKQTSGSSVKFKKEWQQLKLLRAPLTPKGEAWKGRSSLCNCGVLLWASQKQLTQLLLVEGLVGQVVRGDDLELKSEMMDAL